MKIEYKIEHRTGHPAQLCCRQGDSFFFERAVISLQCACLLCVVPNHGHFSAD